MENLGSFLSYADQIRRGWFSNQYGELSRELEIMEHYGYLTGEQRLKLLALARKVEAKSAGEKVEPRRVGFQSPHRVPSINN
jgi:hypothetical protein